MVTGRHSEENTDPARIGVVLLAVEMDGLIQRFGRLVPDTAGLLERIAEIRREAIPPHPRLEVLLTRFGDADPRVLRDELAALGLDVAVRALQADTVILDGAADLSRLAVPNTGVMLLCGREQDARAAIQAGVAAYLVSDRPPVEHWHLLLREAPRVISEAMRLAVPRPIPDSARTGMLIAVPEGDPAAARDRGTASLLLDLHSDWMTIGDTQILYVEEGDASTALLACPGARRLAKDVRLGSLSVATGRSTRSAAVFASGQFSLNSSAQPGDLRWEHVRRARLGARPSSIPSPAETPCSATGSVGEPGVEWLRPMLDFGLVDGKSASPFRCIALPYATPFADRILALVLENGGSNEATASFALRLRERLGGDAVLICWGELEPSRLLWEAERNQLRAIVHVQVGGDPALSEGVEESLPLVPAFIVSGVHSGTDWLGLADNLADRLL